MPVLKFQHVVSVSSEEKSYQAENLLRTEGIGSWRCAKAGEKSASVTLQLEKASKIHKLDIGNDGSAFIEVLVGKASMTNDNDYKVLLVASSFMTPKEARQGNGSTRVRMFDTEKLSQPALDDKWDRVKVVCTQPFNKSTTFGVSFVKVHSPPDPNEKPSSSGDTKPPSAVKMGGFKLKDEDDSSSVKVGSLFANRGKEELKPNTALTGAAAVRAASRAVDETIGTTPSKQVARPPPVHKPHTPQHTDSKPQKRETPSHKTTEKRSRDEGATPKAVLKRQASSTESSSAKKDGPPPLKKTKSEPSKSEKGFSRLLDDVVFVMSGFQNPYRGKLRDKALEMGAKYKPDWDRTCTHLLCAFDNTPKYNEVKKKGGRIVSKHWILDCYEKKKLYSWNKYRLENPSSEESSEEEEEEEYKRKKKTKPDRKKSPEHTITKASPSSSTTSATAAKKESASTLSRSSPKTTTPKHDTGKESSDTEMDTDDEIQRINEAEKKASTPKKVTGDPYDVPTDEESDADTQPTNKNTPPTKTETGNSKTSPEPKEKNENGGLPELPDLPDFFSEKNFFLYGKFAAADRRTLIRYITAFDGTVEDYMSDKVHYVITNSEWDDNFDDALNENSSVAFVRPAWVYACNNEGRMVPHQKYIVTAL